MTNNIDWYTDNQLESFNAYFNFVLGGRGIGKTFNFKRKGLNKNITKGHQFIYLRRNQAELDSMDKDSFFNNDLLSSLFKKYTLESTEVTPKATKISFMGDSSAYEMAITSRMVTINRQIVAYFKALSTWNKLKSSEYDNVFSIMFDEVLIDLASSRRYLPNEVDAFMQIISTVFRHRKNRKIYLLSNSTNYNNPWFNYFNFNGDNSKRFWYLKDFDALFEFAPNKIISEELTPEFFKLSRKSKVFESNVNNEFQQKLTGNIGKLKGDKIRLYSLYCDGTFITAYNANGIFYLAKGYDKNLSVYTTNLACVDMDMIYLERTNPISKHIRRNFYNNSIFYEDMETKNKFSNEVRGLL